MHSFIASCKQLYQFLPHNAILSWYMLSLCLSVCQSITSRQYTKTAKRRITQTTLCDSPGTLVCWCQRSGEIPTESSQTGLLNRGGVG